VYKAAHGDLKIPSRFVVPSMSPWPEAAHGLKLGIRVAAIRSTGRFINHDESRRSLLDSLGFVWRLRSSLDGDVDFDQVYEGLVAYKGEYGDTCVPASFIIPDVPPWPVQIRGLPLGSKVTSVRTKGFMKSNPEAQKKLEELGVEMDGKAAANNVRFKKVYDGLVAYKKVTGDLLVPQPYVIPNEPEFPEETWGLRLGARVNAIRSQGTFVKTDPTRKDMLNEIGFVWEPPSTASGKKRGRRKKEDSEETNSSQASIALGDLPEFQAISQATPTWEKGGEVGDIRSNTELEMAMMELDANQGQWEFDEFNGFELEDVVEALTVYREARGDFDVPRNYVCNEVEVEDSTSIAEGLGLDDVAAEGSADAAPSSDDSEVVKSLMDAIEGIEGLEGLGEDDEDEDEDEEIDGGGLGEEAVGEDDTDDIVSSLFADIVAEEEQEATAKIEFDPKFNGMKLGEMVWRLRIGDVGAKHDPEEKAMLDKIGFHWGDTSKFIRAPFARTLCGLYAYKKIRGDLCVELGFRIPPYDPWPSVLGDYELGKYVNQLRGQKDLLQKEYPLKMQMLNQLNFLWLSKRKD